jgi:hypothetical protein
VRQAIDQRISDSWTKEPENNPVELCANGVEIVYSYKDPAGTQIFSLSRKKP